MERPISKHRILGAAAMLAVAFASPGAHAAGLDEISAGVTIPAPIGTASEILTHPAGAAVGAWIHGPDFFPNSLDFNVSVEYLPYKLRNVSPDTGTQLNLNMIGVYGGVTIWGEPSLLGVRPYFAVGLGALYDFLTIPGAAGTISNTGTAFAMRAMPGLDVPIVSHLGLLIELPATIAFFKTPFGVWQSTFALRWKL